MWPLGAGRVPLLMLLATKVLTSPPAAVVKLAGGLLVVMVSVRSNEPCPMLRYWLSPSKSWLFRTVRAAAAMLSFRPGTAKFQPEPQKIRSTCIALRTGPPLSVMVREPVLLNRIDGTERSSRFSHLGRYTLALPARAAKFPWRRAGCLPVWRFHIVVPPLARNGRSTGRGARWLPLR